MKKRPIYYYGIKDKYGRFWIAKFSLQKRRAARNTKMAFLSECWSEYDLIGKWKPLWKVAYNKGYRCVRVNIKEIK